MEQRCLDPDRGWLGGYCVGEVLWFPLKELPDMKFPDEPMLKVGVLLLIRKIALDLGFIVYLNRKDLTYNIV